MKLNKSFVIILLFILFTQTSFTQKTEVKAKKVETKRKRLARYIEIELISGDFVPMDQITEQNKEMDLIIRSKKDANIVFVDVDEQRLGGQKIDKTTRFFISQNEDNFIVQIGEGEKKKYPLTTRIKLHNAYRVYPHYERGRRKK